MQTGSADRGKGCGIWRVRNLTFGKFESESSVFIRLRYRDMEIYWLVDHSDPEIWEAIAKWKRMGRVPIKFNVLYSQPEQSKLETVSMPLDTSPFVDTGTQGFEGPTSFMWDGMAALTECPYLEASGFPTSQAEYLTRSA